VPDSIESHAMLPGPILRREVRAAVGRRHFAMRTLLAAMLGVPAIAYGLIMFGPAGREPDIFKGFGLRICAALVLASVLLVESSFLLLWVASIVTSSIAEEWEKDPLPLLLLTRLTRAVRRVGRPAAPIGRRGRCDRSRTGRGGSPKASHSLRRRSRVKALRGDGP
jgi:hypothetical protein